MFDCICGERVRPAWRVLRGRSTCSQQSLVQKLANMWVSAVPRLKRAQIGSQSEVWAELAEFVHMLLVCTVSLTHYSSWSILSPCHRWCHAAARLQTPPLPPPRPPRPHPTSIDGPQPPASSAPVVLSAAPTPPMTADKPQSSAKQSAG